MVGQHLIELAQKSELKRISVKVAKIVRFLSGGEDSSHNNACVLP